MMDAERLNFTFIQIFEYGNRSVPERRNLSLSAGRRGIFSRVKQQTVASSDSSLWPGMNPCHLFHWASPSHGILDTDTAIHVRTMATCSLSPDWATVFVRTASSCDCNGTIKWFLHFALSVCFYIGDKLQFTSFDIWNMHFPPNFLHRFYEMP